MLLLFDKSKSLECAKVVVLKLGAILFYIAESIQTSKIMKQISRRSEQAHSTKDKRIRLVGTCRKVTPSLSEIDYLYPSIFFVNGNKVLYFCLFQTNINN